MSENEKSDSNAVPRRNFFREILTLTTGVVAASVPVAVGIGAFTSPLRRSVKSSAAVRVANLSALPADGLPRRFSVIADRFDAWNKYPPSPVGAVYLRRTPADEISAFNVACPHAGCFVDFSETTQSFLCPCHNSSFGLDGKRSTPGSPSPRGLDSLEVEVRNGSEIWVAFKNFRAGEAEKIPAT